MRRILIPVIAFVAFWVAIAPANAAGAWTAQNSGIGQDLYDIDFLDSLNGWTVGRYKYILHTTDGGQNWSVQNKITDPDLLIALDMVTPDTGFAGGFYGYMHRTTDGGATWPGTAIAPGNIIYDIFFINSRVGWAVGGNMIFVGPPGFWQIILKTTDGGDNWNVVRFDSSASVATSEHYGVSFADTLNGIVVGYAGGIFSTTDGGATWGKRDCGKVRDIYDIDHIKGLTFVAVGDTGLIIKTTDGGVTWVTFSSDSMGYLRAVDFVDSSNGWLVGCRQNLPYKGIIMNTTDGGDLWGFQINTDYWLYGVKFINRDFGWACGSMGNIYKYYDPTGVEGKINDDHLTKSNQKLKCSPNPFISSVLIKYGSSNKNVLTLKIYNIQGKLVKTITENKNSELSFVWNGKDQRGNVLPCGIYFCQANQDGISKAIKLIKLK